jgi:3-oxoacyl-[acyl-carrier protein] reductase
MPPPGCIRRTEPRLPKKQFIAQTPLGRFGRPEDIAHIAVFLASDVSGWLTGEILHASGGAR